MSANYCMMLKNWLTRQYMSLWSARVTSEECSYAVIRGRFHALKMMCKHSHGMLLCPLLKCTSRPAVWLSIVWSLEGLCGSFQPRNKKNNYFFTNENIVPFMHTMSLIGLGSTGGICWWIQGDGMGYLPLGRGRVCVCVCVCVCVKGGGGG